jgi:hypothetical protein
MPDLVDHGARSFRTGRPADRFDALVILGSRGSISLGPDLASGAGNSVARPAGMLPNRQR